MKKTIVVAFIAILTFSCSNDNQESNKTGQTGAVYKIAELPVLPSFAKPIEKAGETRQFTLIKNDGTALNFEFKSIEQTVFGKMRTLIGTVNSANQEDKAVMVLGENGFQLTFNNNGENFTLKGKNELELGYKNLNLDENTKKNFLAAANKKGYDTTELLDNLNNLNKKVGNETSRYEVAVEKSNNYNLINETSSLEKRISAEGKGICPTNSLLNASKNMNTSSKNTPQQYNIEIVFQQDTYDFAAAYSGLIFSLLSTDFSTEKIHPIPNIYQINFNDLISNINYLTNWALAIVKVSNSGDQLNRLSNFCNNFPSPNAKSGKLVRVALYEDRWDDSVLGLAWVGGYTNIPKYSTLVVCDDSPSVLAHECGHNLGATHVNNPKDLMYKYASNNFAHLDPINIQEILNSFGFN
ncbi:zinc-dependent metalloprotease family protein [uncultured Flavobacterium sp.]|uniref:zinc-dependent metalloprotease family protein n=1 Tax=uncultured Flavobacterium sp. TaxID=165435 RepID=UPI0025DB7766|nr:zinc-dependent metalloprotease family protein [uncultured Flavobacterium sp.]